MATCPAAVGATRRSSIAPLRAMRGQRRSLGAGPLVTSYGDIGRPRPGRDRIAERVDIAAQHNSSEAAQGLDGPGEHDER